MRAGGEYNNNPVAVDTQGLMRWLLPAGVVLALAGCGSAPKHSDFLPGQDGAPSRTVDVSRVPDAIPRAEPRSRYGNPASYVVAGKRYRVMHSARGYRARGNASWYGTKFHGRRTSSGETYDMYTMTAAHRELPLPTYVQVTNLNNGRKVIVRVNDRGPFHPDRIIDLSYAAAKKLGFIQHGTAPVEVVAIDPSAWRGRRIAEAAGTAPSSGAATGLYLQVGAFSSRGNAERLRERLTGDFDTVHIHEGRSGAAPVYRVRLGPFGSSREADRTHGELGRFGILDATVVTD